MSGTNDRDLTGAWALDALTDEERADFERYLATDDDARAEATELADTAVLLGMAVPEVPPPSGVRTRVLALAADLPQVSADEVETVRSAGPVAERMPAGRHQVPRRAQRRFVSTGRTLRFTTRTAAMFAASLVVLAGLVVGGVAVRTTLTPTAETQAISQIQNAADARTARASIAGGGVATVTWSDKQARSALTVRDLAAAPSNRVYQLWYIDSIGVARSAGLFTPDNGNRTVALTGHLRDGDTVGVTVEPKGGSTSPTTTPIVAIQTA